MASLQGIGAAPGVAEGEVTVVLGGQGLDEFPDGHVLVADTVNPTMASVFQKARACVTDGGGKTSHAAIFAREHGIPCVVGAATATKEFASGARVSVNGDTGEVTTLE